MGLPTPVDGGAPSYFGVYPAIVTDIVDPDQLGRVQVKFPWLGTDGEQDVRVWATLCSPYADGDQGLLILPEVDSQGLVAFEGGNLNRAWYLGAAWNGQKPFPHPAEVANNIRLLRSRSDSRIEIDDTGGAEKVTISTASGHRVVLDNSSSQVTVQHATGCTVRLTLTAVEITANVTVDVTAAMVNVNAPISTFSGIVKCNTLIAESTVISPAYTPGAGNIW
jgi:uncharacterized protein involved in type VI secretion and phage assembly